MKNKIYKQKWYKHIDKTINIKDVINKVQNPNFIKSHGFYPFISYSLEFKKFSNEINEETNHHYKIKRRPIKYASHIDRCIYQWYSFQLNKKYNDYCEHSGLNESSIAYRTCLKGKTNIEFSAEAFKFIKACESCYIIVSDFTDFFDKIDHKMLKEKLCEVLNAEELSDDFYKVFKSMTDYSYIEKEDIIHFLISNGYETEETIKKNNCYFERISWKDAKKHLKDKIKKNENNYGIPQGSPLSGVFANVYMIDFDKKARDYANSKNGIYMRYSDDLIMIIPTKSSDSINEIWENLKKIKDEYNTLEMNVNKTSGYLFKNKRIFSLHKEIKGLKEGSDFISYLGFSFDGENVSFRDKTLTKFFYKYYKKIDSMVYREYIRIKKGKKRHTKINKKRILKTIDEKMGARTFITYVNRARRVYKNEKYIRNFRKEIKNKTFLRFEKEKRRIEKQNIPLEKLVIDL